ncbi:MAG TPA: copper homeostasis protein CutC [Fimbriiglobus sp.]
MPRILLEAACETVDDALAATAGGADRIELCSALDLDGLTPSVGLYREVRSATPLPIVVMLRPRSGDFVYSDADLRALRNDLDQFRSLEPNAVIFGILTRDGMIDEARCSDLIQLARGVPCVFHRAFDLCRDRSSGLESLIRIGFRRVLTSGGAEKASDGVSILRELNDLAAGRIEILPGGGIRAGSAAAIVAATGCRQLHASFAEDIPESREINRLGSPLRRRVSRDQVAATRAAVDKIK